MDATQNVPDAEQCTFAMIKPDAMEDGHMLKILVDYIPPDLRIIACRMEQLSERQAYQLYGAEHAGRPYFGDLIRFATSGPVLLLALEGRLAISRWRDMVGVANPKNAAAGTIRRLLGKGMPNNAVHGSDSQEAAQRELGIFFNSCELFPVDWSN